MEEVKKIIFKEHLAPSLKAGVYKINAQIEIKGLGKPNDIIAQKTEWIGIGGERFNLDPGDIDSIYPPENGFGKYDSILPHIVFNRASILWERTIEVSDDLNGGPKKQEDGEQYKIEKGWLGLLLFDQEDGYPEVKRIKATDLLQSNLPSYIKFSDFELEPDEKSTDECNIIDIPVPLFEKIKPSADDLSYLAHARKVNTANKAEIHQKNISDSSDHEYSVLVSNRLPQRSRESMVYLVSFEACQPILDQSVPNEYTHVRLITLKQWRFSTENTGGSFTDYFGNLNHGKNCPSYLKYPIEDRDSVDDYVASIMSQGYLPMQHFLRQGKQSISWYRSPLSPIIPLDIVSGSYRSSDSLLIYDPKMSLFDVSYAAAWQLGQLLGLRNKSFAKAMYFWKLQTSIDVRKEFERDILKQELDMDIVTNDHGKVLIPNFNENDFPNYNELDDFNLNENENAISLAEQQGVKLTDFPQVDKSIEPKRIDETDSIVLIKKYLFGFKSLRDVPYNYLIADPKMLPKESMRFFHIDHNWIAALVDGAFSIGDVISKDQQRKDYLKYNNTEKVDKGYSGFILRTKAIQIWPGIEVECFDDSSKLSMKRLQKLSDDVLIGIVKGNCSKVHFYEPPEGISFGLTSKGGSMLKGNINLTKNGIQNPILDINNKVHIKRLQEKIKKGMNTADFGYEMLKDRIKIVLTLEKN